MSDIIKNARILTPCNSCIFAQYDNENTQYGCSANMLENFKKQGVKIEEATDNIKNYYLIIDKICLLRRDNKWLENIKEKFGKKYKTYTEDLVDFAKKEVEKSLSIDAIIYINDSSKDNLYKTIDSIYQEDVLPTRMCFVINVEASNNSLIISYIKAYKHKIPWNIDITINKDLSTREALDCFTNTKCESAYYATFITGRSIEKDIFKKFKERFSNGEKIMYIEGDDIHNEIVNFKIHHFLHGNSQLSIIDKIKGLTTNADA